MRTIKYTRQFKKDYKREKRSARYRQTLDKDIITYSIRCSPDSRSTTISKRNIHQQEGHKEDNNQEHEAGNPKSGITTTGSTVLSGLDNMSHSILLWRSLLQWLGGIGFIVMGVAILPMLNVGGMRLFQTESSDWSAGSLNLFRSCSTNMHLRCQSLIF